MKKNSTFLGYGWSASGLEADCPDPSAAMPAKGPDCPLTADLLDLALTLVDPEAEDTLRKHLTKCAYCEARYLAQCRAVQQAEGLRTAVPAPTPRERMAKELAARIRNIRVGAVQMLRLKPLKADGDAPVKQYVCLTLPEQASMQDGLNALLHWTAVRRPNNASRDAESWSLILRLPTRQSDADHGNADADLQSFDRRRIVLSLLPRNGGRTHFVDTQLLWATDRTALVTHPSTVRLDNPERIQFVEFSPRETIGVHDVS
jgi:hypothetical protein